MRLGLWEPRQHLPSFGTGPGAEARPQDPGVRRDLAGAGLRAESAAERLWRELGGCTVLNEYRTAGQQRLGPNGSGGGGTADKPTPGTKADKQSQRPFHSLSLCHLFLPRRLSVRYQRPRTLSVKREEEEEEEERGLSD
ncbi:hypothetical protein INR49_003047 [Caranx melampygus]|nr:hypothetical protein INR49_003047 [Caranx melampygus]